MPAAAASAMPAIAPDPMPALAVCACPAEAPRALEFELLGAEARAGTRERAVGGRPAPFAGDSSGPKALLAAICSADCEVFAADGSEGLRGGAAGVGPGLATGVGLTAGVVCFGKLAGEVDESASVGAGVTCSGRVAFGVPC